MTVRTLLSVVHLAIAAIWLGSMVYSLGVVQPRVARFFSDDRRREEFLITLADGNRWRVVALIGALLLTAVAVILVAPGTVAAGYAVVVVLYLAASSVFVHVSWRHWPARVFAAPRDLPGFRRQLQIQAWAMLVLVAAAFLTALSVSVAVR